MWSSVHRTSAMQWSRQEIICRITQIAQWSLKPFSVSQGSAKSECLKLYTQVSDKKKQKKTTEASVLGGEWYALLRYKARSTSRT